jgi:hypothetical protein
MLQHIVDIPVRISRLRKSALKDADHGMTDVRQPCEKSVVYVVCHDWKRTLKRKTFVPHGVSIFCIPSRRYTHVLSCAEHVQAGALITCHGVGLQHSWVNGSCRFLSERLYQRRRDVSRSKVACRFVSLQHNRRRGVTTLCMDAERFGIFRFDSLGL